MSASGPRVLHLTPTLFSAEGGIIGGAERYSFELARHMAKKTPTRFLTFGDEERRFDEDGLSVRMIGRPWRVRGQQSNPLSWKILPEVRRADVIHCHQQHVLASSLAAAQGRLLRRRVFVTDLGGGGWDVSAYLSTDSWYHAHLHLSRYSRRVFGHQGRASAHVIYGGVDGEKFSPDETLARRDTVLFVGRLLPHKGVHDLIAALPPNLALEIVGRPYDRRYLEDLQRLAEGKRVRFRHDCDDRELVDAYRQALCIVLPSVYRTPYGATSKVPELLGQTLLEGMACGAPAVCTDVASLPEVVDDGVTGFVVPAGDPESLGERLRRLAADPELAARLGRAGRRRVLERFTWEQVVDRCLEIYRC